MLRNANKYQKNSSNFLQKKNWKKNININDFDILKIKFLMSVYNRSKLYKIYIESHNEQEIQELFQQQFKERCNLTESQVAFFWIILVK